jgi:hypothetical protein
MLLMSPNRWMGRAENCRCERAVSASRTPSAGRSSSGRRLGIHGRQPRLGGRVGIVHTGGATVMRPSTLSKGISRAQAQCFASGWIYAGEMFDFSWRRFEGDLARKPNGECSSGVLPQLHPLIRARSAEHDRNSYDCDRE